MKKAKMLAKIIAVFLLVLSLMQLLPLTTMASAADEWRAERLQKALETPFPKNQTLPLAGNGHLYR